MKQKYVCCNSLKNLLTAILFFIALVFTSNAFAVECTDSVDNDNDGLIDANDLGCQGECGTTYYCGDSTTDRSMTDGNEKGREVPFTTVYNVTNDGEVTLEMKNDDVVFVLKRVEDGKTYVIGICNEWVDEVGSDLAPLPVNQSTALGAVGSGGRNEAAVYDRNGNLQIHFPVDGSHTCPQAARSDTSAGRTTVAQRSVKVKKGDKIYINTRHEKDLGAREHNGISFRKTCTKNPCLETQAYTSTETDNGKDYKNKGTTTYTKGLKSISVTDYCVSDTVLAEYYKTTTPKFGSDKKPTEGNGLVKYTCAYRCSAGACIPQCTKDSDCQSGYKCSNEVCVKKSECEDGVDNDGDGLTDSKDPGCQNCSGSACKENQSYTSSDTDGGNNPDKKGTATYKKGSGTAKTATDTCESNKVLVEYYNTTNPKFGSNGKPVSGRGMKKHTCEFTCAEGACQPQCKIDPDCPSNEKCVEGRCVAKGECEDGVDNDGDGLTDSKDPGCQNCSGSACKENQSYTSSDTDGGNNPDKKGTATYKKGSGTAKTATDTCENDKVLIEYYNTTNPKFGSNGKPVSGRGMTKHTCEFTCKEGACQPQCKVDSDCPSGQKCENNICIDDVKAVQPLAECVYDNGDGTFIAYFGYENNNAEVVTTKACDDNTGTRNNNVVVIKGSDYIKWECSSQPTTLETGRVKGAFYVQFRREESVTWSLETNSEGTKEATLDAQSVRCAELAPVVRCIDINNDGTLQAYFGYKNMNDFELHIPVGSNNKVIPSPEDRGQPENFFGGNNNNAFDEKFESNANLKWELDGITVIADKTMNTCRPNSAPTCQDDGQTLSVECQGDVTTMQVNASSCKDPESNKLSYSWSTDCKGASMTHQNEVIATLSLTEPGLGKDQTCKVSVTVTDGIKETTMTQNVKVSACVIAECFDAKGNPGSYDQCGVCNGDNLTCADCHGVPNGKGVIDLCGVCDGNNACVDCAGIPYGTSVLDRCNTCNGDGTSCLECSDPTDVKGLKAGLHGDEFVTMLDEQTEELLDEENPYPLIRDIEASAERRVNRAEKKNDQIKALLAGLPDKMETCNNDKFCSQNDNEPTLNTIKRYLRKLRRQVGRTVRQRNISEKERQSLLNTNAKLLAGKLDILNKIPRFYSICK